MEVTKKMVNGSQYDILGWVILLGVAGMLAAAMSIGLGSMANTNAWSANANTSITNSDQGLLNLTAQFQTIGTIVGVVALIAVVLGVAVLVGGTRGF